MSTTPQTDLNRHRSAARTLLYALQANDQETWGKTAAVFMVRLSSAERLAVAWVAISALGDEGLGKVIDALSSETPE
ncbi:MAG: hypothetical protein AAFO80_12520 [Pseudomonadota bacterium]